MSLYCHYCHRLFSRGDSRIRHEKHGCQWEGGENTQEHASKITFPSGQQNGNLNTIEIREDTLQSVYGPSLYWTGAVPKLILLIFPVLPCWWEAYTDKHCQQKGKGQLASPRSALADFVVFNLTICFAWLPAAVNVAGPDPSIFRVQKNVHCRQDGLTVSCNPMLSLLLQWSFLFTFSVCWEA